MDQLDIERVPGSYADVTVFRLKGPFTLSTLFQFQATLREPSLKSVIIDLSGVPYMDSASLGVLLSHWAHTQRAGIRYALVGITPRVRTIFEITHTDTVLPIFATQEDAEKVFVRAVTA
jgi:anti-sigma B factor antagonist